MTLNSIKIEDSSGNANDGAEASSSSGSGQSNGVHKVCLPPQRTTFQKLRHRLAEIFFPDDPLHRFKNQTTLRKFVLGLQFFLPVFEWGPKYNLMLFKSDIIAGITIASLSIPQGISYAKLANLPPIIGLCKCQSLSNSFSVFSPIFVAINELSLLATTFLKNFYALYVSNVIRNYIIFFNNRGIQANFHVS